MAATALTVAAAPAAATFPGKNGPIAYDRHYTKGFNTSNVEVAARGGRIRSLQQCEVLGAGGCWAGLGGFSRSGELALTLHGYPGGLSQPPAGGVLKVLSADLAQVRAVDLLEPSYDPAWSSDGTMLVATRRSGGSPYVESPTDLFLLGADGRELGRVTHEGASQPDWSVRGAIAYVHGGEVWVTRLGGQPRRVTVGGGTAPSWAPSGRALAFVRNGEIWRAREDGRGARRLTRGGLDSEPAWSPDGRWIAFVRREDRFGDAGDLMLVSPRSARAHRSRLKGRVDGVSKLAWKPLPRR